MMRARIDAGCVLREARSDPAAFAELVAMEGGWLRDFFAERGAGVRDAELLAAETLAKAYIDRARFRGVTEQDGVEWLTALAYRRLARFNHLGTTEHRGLDRLGVADAACQESPLRALASTLAAGPDNRRRRFTRVAPRAV